LGRFAPPVFPSGLSEAGWHEVSGRILGFLGAEPRKEIPTIYFAPYDRHAHESTVDAKRLNFWDGLADNGAPKITARNRNGTIHVGKLSGLYDDFPDDQYREVHRSQCPGPILSGFLGADGNALL
jgi:hypothetical protein